MRLLYPRFIYIYRNKINIVHTKAAHFLASWQPFWSCGTSQDVLNIGIILDPQTLLKILLKTVSLIHQFHQFFHIFQYLKCSRLTQRTLSWLGHKDKSQNSGAAIGGAVVHAICSPIHPLSEPAVVQYAGKLCYSDQKRLVCKILYCILQYNISEQIITSYRCYSECCGRPYQVQPGGMWRFFAVSFLPPSCSERCAIMFMKLIQPSLASHITMHLPKLNVLFPFSAAVLYFVCVEEEDFIIASCPLWSHVTWSCSYCFQRTTITL